MKWDSIISADLLELSAEESASVAGGFNWLDVATFIASPALGFFHMGVKNGMRLAHKDFKN